MCTKSNPLFDILNRQRTFCKPINCAQIRTKGAFVSSADTSEMVSSDVSSLPGLPPFFYLARVVFCNTGVFFERATAACSCSFVMPWLSWKIGDSSKKAVWKIGIVETAALCWALRRTSTFLEFNKVPGYVRRRKGRGKGEEKGDSIVSPLLPSLSSPFFSPFSQASRTSPFIVSFP